MLKCFALFFLLLLSPQGHHSHSQSAALKGYVHCNGTPNHKGGYYYNVSPNSKRGLLDTLPAIALSYRLPLAAIAADNPLVTVDQVLPLGMSICIPYV